MRLRHDNDAMNKLHESKFLATEYPIIVNKNTVIELGMGKGEMLTKLASLNPDVDFIGVEKYPTVAAKAIKSANDYNLINFKIVVEDIINIPAVFSGKVGTIWLTFSDPWPKKRHAKRRLTFKAFLDIYQELLTEEGVIKLKTDNDSFFSWSLEQFTTCGWELTNVTNDFHKHEASKENEMTGYELKWSSKGKAINYLEARRP